MTTQPVSEEGDKKGKRAIIENESYFKIDPEFLSNLAAKIVTDCLGVKPGENVTIETWNHGLEIAREFAFQVRKKGAHPLLMLEDENNFWRAATEIPPDRLGKVGKHEWAMLQKTDAYIFLPGPEHQDRLDDLPEDISDRLFGYGEEWYKRARKYRIRGLRIGFGYMNNKRAKKLGVDFDKWVDEELKAYDVDYPKLEKEGKKLSKILKNGKKVRITQSNGTDLKFRLRKSKGNPLMDVGVMKDQYDPKKGQTYSVLTNLPSGSVLTVPKEDSAKGVINFNLPSPSGKDFAHDISLTFGKNGLVSKYSGGQNFNKGFKEKFEAEAKKDKGRIALFSVGVNPKQKIGFGYDDSSEGVVLLGIGHYSYGDRNKTEFQFYGLIGEATVTVDG
ncbi:MAG: aminopeptidase, partial [Nitrososphaerales archaeon]